MVTTLGWMEEFEAEASFESPCDECSKEYDNDERKNELEVGPSCNCRSPYPPFPHSQAFFSSPPPLTPA